jgi:hypothetical protein
MLRTLQHLAIHEPSKFQLATKQKRSFLFVGYSYRFRVWADRLASSLANYAQSPNIIEADFRTDQQTS